MMKRALTFMMLACISYEPHINAAGNIQSRCVDGRTSYALSPMEQWVVTPDSWTAVGDYGKELSDPEAIGAQFGRDAILMYNTLFPNLDQGKVLKILQKYPRAKERAQDKAIFLKRLLLLLHYAGVKMAYENNDVNALCNWDLPLAALFGHGQRFLIELRGGLKAKEVVKFLTAPVKGKKKIFYKRLFASHATRHVASKLFEHKYGKTLKKSGRLKSSLFSKVGGFFGMLRDGIMGRHHGFDLPYGGLGNPSLSVVRKKKDVVTYVGPNGSVLYGDTLKKVSKLQQGHLYMHIQQHGKKGAALLVGLEATAPGKKSIYNNAHNFASGMKDSTSDASVSGGHKWQKIWLRDHAGNFVRIGQYGSVRIKITQKEFAAINQKINAFLALSEEEQRMQMRQILLNPPGDAALSTRAVSAAGKNPAHIGISPVREPHILNPSSTVENVRPGPGKNPPEAALKSAGAP